MDNNNMLNEMIENPDEAIKSITVSDLGYSVLQPQYFNQFVREATRNQTILAEARRISIRGNIELLRNKNYEAWKQVYEEFYGVPLSYED